MKQWLAKTYHHAKYLITSPLLWSWQHKYRLLIVAFSVIAVGQFLLSNWRGLWPVGISLLDHRLQHAVAFLRLPNEIPQASPYASLNLGDYAQLDKEYQQLWLTLFGGLIAVLTLLISLDKFDQNRKEHRNQRFKDTIELLGHDAMDVRLGAIYTLQQLMTDHPEQLGVQVVNILAAYIRNRGGQVSRAYQSKLSFLEKRIKRDTALDADTEREALKKLPWHKLADRDEVEKTPPTTYPYTDIIAGLEVLAERVLPPAIEKQVDFNLDGLTHHLFKSPNKTLVDVYQGSGIQKGSLADKNFKEASLREVNLTKENLVKAYFDGANLAEATFEGANLEQASLKATNLVASYLAGANFSRADLRDANLVTADLEGATLENTTLVRASLEWTSLVGANLRGADLRVADLQGANLRDADLRDSDLQGADLRDVDMQGVELQGAYLHRTDMLRAFQLDENKTKVLLTFDDLKKQGLTYWDEKTTFPDGTHRDQDGNLISSGV